MNGRERLLAAFRRQPVDELPVVLKGMEPCSPARVFRDESWNPVFERYAQTGDILPMMSATADLSVDGPVRARSRCVERTEEYEEREIVFQTPAGELTMRCRDLFLKEATLEYAVKTAADLPAARWVLSQPVTVDTSATRESFETMSASPHSLPMLFVQEPIDRVVDLMGPTSYALALIESPAALADLTEAAMGPIAASLETVLQSGIRPVIWIDGAEMVTPPYAGPERSRELVYPYLRQLVDLAHRYDCVVLHHCHGRIAGVLDQLLETGIDATHPFEPPPSGDITAAELKARTGRSLCYVGNIQLDDMLRAPRAHIEQLVEGLLETFCDWRDGGFILSISGTPTCREAWPQALENYLYLLDCKRL